MKKVLALLLVLSMVLVVFAACSPAANESSTTESSATEDTSSTEESSTTGESSADETSADETSADETSADETSADETSADETSADETSADETSADESSAEESSADETSDEAQELIIADYISYASPQYISWSDPTVSSLAKGGIVSVRSTNPTALKLTGLNEGVVDGTASIIAFTRDYGKTIASKKGTYDDYAVFLMEYNEETWHYELTTTYDVGSATSDIKIPSDGFAVAIHKYFADSITKLKGVDANTCFYPHGFRGTNDLDAVISSGTCTVDGKVSEKEYGSPIWEIEADNTLCSYEQFETDNYYSTAKVYMKYDSDNLYFGVVVTSPYHYNPCTSANAYNMYNYECIQVNVTSTNPLGEYISQHWDNVIDGTAVAANVVRQYGFCVNDNDETLSTVWMGTPKSFGGNVVCIRDEDAQQTIYEVSIPWSECGSGDMVVTGTKGEDFGFSLSVNSGTTTKNFMNIFLRDGGGIIGLNDWSKVPTITLG